MIKKIILKSIRLYQRTISPDHGAIRHSTCRFHPSCSEYSHTAISRFGIVKGLGLSIWRVLRCHPFGKGGIDRVPQS